jgi:DNA-binding response OmpR family regulator
MEQTESAATSLPPRVLIAEDDDDMRLLLCEAFRKDGYAVDEVEDGHELHDYLEACFPWGKLPRPDVVVSDIRMPGRTALEVLAKLTANHSRVVLITAFGDAKTHLEGRMLGATAVLDKPVDLDVLRATVRRLVRGEPHDGPGANARKG